MTTYAVINPATGAQVSEYPTAHDTEIVDAVERSDASFRSWKQSTPEQRAAMLHRVAVIYQERRHDLASLITQEMGKPITQSLAEVDIAADIHRYYADNGPGLLADKPIQPTAGGEAVVRREPLGPLLGIMPWNYPYYQVARFAAPNLMNGNTILLKHAPQCPSSALAMEQIYLEAGFPQDVYINIFATNQQCAEIIADPRVHGVSLTGSEKAGMSVAETAGRHLKKVVLELGGSDPFLVLDTTDLDTVISHAVTGRLVNGGQACNAAKRFIIVDEYYDEFVEKLSEAFENVIPADPTDPQTFLGPLSSLRAAQQLAVQVDDAVAQGATIKAGGTYENGSAFYPPTLLTNVDANMAIYQQELFGPVAVAYRARNADHAVELANDSPFGLGASVHADNARLAQDVANRLETGMVYINEPSGTSAELPFGGVKRSGIGRELGPYGMDEFTNRKLVRTAKP